ncbi:MAG: ATP-dependent RecD-like DNA helicase [Candidatus Dependentiae bacterium]|nr:ATP-dependent RecD-like DNA helicase [Candidatus Dependentiae bacterium]
MNQNVHTEPSEKIEGIVGRFLFKSPDDAFVVFVLEPSQNAPGEKGAVVRGYLPAIAEGQDVVLSGSWTVHPKFGRQFNAHHSEVTLPTSVEGLKKYLGSGIIKGIGPSYAEKLVAHFGVDVLSIIDTEPHRLTHVEGIGPKRAADIVEAWQRHKAIANLMVFLHSKGISTSLALRIYKRYGDNAVAHITQNPYRLATEVWGVGFLTADRIAQNLDIAPNDPRRIAAGLEYVLSVATTQGHLYVEETKLREKATEALALQPEQHPLLDSAIAQLARQNLVVSVPYQGQEFVGLATHFALEQEVVRHLARLLQTSPSKELNTTALYESLRAPTAGKLELNEDQQRGIMTALAGKVSIITGGPGTGKTTLVRTLLTLLDQERCTYRLAAPTGRAAKRLSESTGRFATTIHRLLEFKPENGKFVHDESNTLKLDFLIVDETSMIDIFLAAAILRALPSTARLLFIGDANQLPSVGPGNVLKDLIASKKIPCIILTKIFRQAQSSLITVNAHRVQNGEFPTTSIEGSRRDFAFIKMGEAATLAPLLKRLFAGELKKRGFEHTDVQILTPMNRGVAGTHVLNSLVQGLVFPEARAAITHNGSSFHVGDRVMQLRNNYDKNVFNGDIGRIETVAPEERKLQIRFPDGGLVDYEQEDLDELVLAYATTIHKSQGSEYPVVIIPIFMQHFMLLQKNLLYTALTRAQKLCILIGEPRAIAMAIKKADATQRVTFLVELLK